VVVFMTSFAAMLVTTVHNFGMSNGYEVMGTFGVVFAVAIFAIALFEVLYSRSMVASGVLA